MIVVAAAYAAALAGRTALSVFAIAFLVLAYIELRRLLVRRGSRLSLVLGAAAVGVLAWIGTQGRPQDIVWVFVVLVLTLLVGRVVLAELGARTPAGTTADVGATVAAAGVVGALGAHVLLVRAVPGFGLRGVLVFLTVAVAGTVAGAAGDRFGRHPTPGGWRRWEGVVAQVAVAAVAGVVAAIVAGAPFAADSGVSLGIGVGILLAVGGLAGRALAEAADGTAPVFGLASGPLLAAPAFYWAFRTLVV